MKALLIAALAISQAAWAQEPVVTATKMVEYRKTQVQLRKINGRWFSPDNREVYPPHPGEVFWIFDALPGVVQFLHHRPFELSRAETLHLWMSPSEVEFALGQPNQTFGPEGHAFWFYYAANGTKLSVRFMGEGVLGEASYSNVGEKSWPVASVEQELAGRDIYKLLQERATERVGRVRLGPPRREQAVSSTAALRDPIPDPFVPKRTVPAAALASIAPGLSREELLTRLGEPSYRSTINGGDGVTESLTYDLDTGQKVVIRVEGGKVTQVRRPQ